jgi:hypothetical protein
MAIGPEWLRVLFDSQRVFFKEEDEMSEELKPEPAVVFEGSVTDHTEHAPMLDNQQANDLADRAAIQAAMEIGLTREVAEKLIGGPFDVTSLETPARTTARFTSKTAP